MDRHDTRDLDGIIDDVACAMTGGDLRRDLRPAIAARVTRPSWWTFGWRTGLAAAAMAAVVLTVVVTRPGTGPDIESGRAPSSAVADGSGRETVAPAGPQSVEPASTASLSAVAAPRLARVVARQTIDAGQATGDVVEIAPLAIVPLEDSGATEITLMSKGVEIVPIDVEPLRISELEQVE